MKSDRLWSGRTGLGTARRKHFAQLPPCLQKPCFGSAFGDSQYRGDLAVFQPFDFKHQQNAAVTWVQLAERPFERKAQRVIFSDGPLPGWCLRLRAELFGAPYPLTTQVVTDVDENTIQPR